MKKQKDAAAVQAQFSRLNPRAAHLLFPLALFPLLLLTANSVAQPTETKRGEYPNPQRFEKAIAAFEATDREAPPPKDAILCIGSSSMRGWHEMLAQDLAPLTVIGRGFGGSTMNDALDLSARIVVPYQPRAVVVYEGDNDVAQGIQPQVIRETFHAFVQEVHKRLPETRIYFLSIKPSVRRWAMWRDMRKANKLIAQECSRNKLLTFVDVAAGMLDSDGEVRPDIFKQDNLHMNRKGYEIWRGILRPVLIKSELPFEPQPPAGNRQP